MLNRLGSWDTKLRFLLEQNGQTIAVVRDFRRYVIKPKMKVVYAFDDKDELYSKHEYITERLDIRDSKMDLREFCLVIEVGKKLTITDCERSGCCTGEKSD